MRSRTHLLRLAALVGAGALVVHRLRYLAGYGADSGEALGRHGHGYLWIVLVVTVAALCLAGASVAYALARASGTGQATERPPRSFTALWWRASAGLTALYVVQESLEGLLAPGHAGGLAGVAGHGGWTAFVLALAVGALIALLVRGAHAAVVRAAGRPGRPPSRRSVSATARPAPVRWALASPLARHLAGRRPPLSSR
ncbi:MAG: hypothetical protein ACR2KD_02090 [Thermoleophilaceae bacterium]